MQEGSVNDLGDAQGTLQQAGNLLNYSDPGTAGLWPRAVALLARQALESGLRAFWLANAPGVEGCSNKAQLLALTEFIDEEDAELARQTWAALSRACHHHPYELSPTSQELEHLISSVQQTLGGLRAH